jgi:pimeloyl-ACP methyl ester carboxylesterase
MGRNLQPSETGLVEDAAAAYAFTIARYPAERVVLWDESLGSALALAMAAEKPVGHIVLEAPFTSAADVGAQRYWFVPVRLFMKDQFRSDLRADNHALAVGGVEHRLLRLRQARRPRVGALAVRKILERALRYVKQRHEPAIKAHRSEKPFQHDLEPCDQLVEETLFGSDFK